MLVIRIRSVSVRVPVPSAMNWESRLTHASYQHFWEVHTCPYHVRRIKTDPCFRPTFIMWGESRLTHASDQHAADTKPIWLQPWISALSCSINTAWCFLASSSLLLISSMLGGSKSKSDRSTASRQSSSTARSSCTMNWNAHLKLSGMALSPGALFVELNSFQLFEIVVEIVESITKNK